MSGQKKNKEHQNTPLGPARAGTDGPARAGTDGMGAWGLINIQRP